MPIRQSFGQLGAGRLGVGTCMAEPRKTAALQLMLYQAYQNQMDLTEPLRSAAAAVCHFPQHGSGRDAGQAASPASPPRSN